MFKLKWKMLKVKTCGQIKRSLCCKEILLLIVGLNQRYLMNDSHSVILLMLIIWSKTIMLEFSIF